MMALNKKMDVISNNMANVNTTAYKKDTVVFESFPEVLTRRINDMRSSLNPSGRVGTMELSSDVGEIFTHFKQGQLVRTDGKLDFAFRNSDTAFYSVYAPDAEGNMREYYTRDGQFTVDPEGRLVTKDGYEVAGEDGPIYLYEGEVIIEEDGTVIQNGEVAGKLIIREFANPETLRKFGSNMVEATEETQEVEFSGSVVQGFAEQSNVNIVREMVDMITVMRSYEANQKVIQTLDGTLEKVVNEVGAVR